MKRYVIEHYTQGGYFLMGVKTWYGIRYIRCYHNSAADLTTRKWATRRSTMAEAEQVINEYHEYHYGSTVKIFDMIINESRLKRVKEKASSGLIIVKK